MSIGARRVPLRLSGLMMAVTLAFVSGVTVHAQWQWPLPAESLSSSQITNDLISPWWSIVGSPTDRGDSRSVYRFVAPGTVVYHETGDITARGMPTVPRAGDLVVLQHGDGLWSFYRGTDLELADGSWSANVQVDGEIEFSAEGSVSFAIFDAVRNKFVNARAILPESETVPDDGLPVVGFVQNGSLTLSRNLVVGETQFVVPQQWLEPATLPRRLFVRVDGLLQAEIDLTAPQEVVPRLTPDGNLLLLPMNLEPGPIVVEVESHQFDGSIERRTIPFRVPNPGLLDTP